MRPWLGVANRTRARVSTIGVQEKRSRPSTSKTLFPPARPSSPILSSGPTGVPGPSSRQGSVVYVVDDDDEDREGESEVEYSNGSPNIRDESDDPDSEEEGHASRPSSSPELLLPPEYLPQYSRVRGAFDVSHRSILSTDRVMCPVDEDDEGNDRKVKENSNHDGDCNEETKDNSDEDGYLVVPSNFHFRKPLPSSARGRGRRGRLRLIASPPEGNSAMEPSHRNPGVGQGTDEVFGKVAVTKTGGSGLPPCYGKPMASPLLSAFHARYPFIPPQNADTCSIDKDEDHDHVVEDSSDEDTYLKKSKNAYSKKPLSSSSWGRGRGCGRGRGHRGRSGIPVSAPQTNLNIEFPDRDPDEGHVVGVTGFSRSGPPLLYSGSGPPVRNEAPPSTSSTVVAPQAGVSVATRTRSRFSNAPWASATRKPAPLLVCLDSSDEYDGLSQMREEPSVGDSGAAPADDNSNEICSAAPADDLCKNKLESTEAPDSAEFTKDDGWDNLGEKGNGNTLEKDKLDTEAEPSVRGGHTAITEYVTCEDENFSAEHSPPVNGEKGNGNTLEKDKLNTLLATSSNCIDGIMQHFPVASVVGERELVCLDLNLKSVDDATDGAKYADCHKLGEEGSVKPLEEEDELGSEAKLSVHAGHTAIPVDGVCEDENLTAEPSPPANGDDTPGALLAAPSNWVDEIRQHSPVASSVHSDHTSAAANGSCEDDRFTKEPLVPVPALGSSEQEENIGNEPSIPGSGGDPNYNNEREEKSESIHATNYVGECKEEMLMQQDFPIPSPGAKTVECQEDMKVLQDPPVASQGETNLFHLREERKPEVGCDGMEGTSLGSERGENTVHSMSSSSQQVEADTGGTHLQAEGDRASIVGGIFEASLENTNSPMQQDTELEPEALRGDVSVSSTSNNSDQESLATSSSKFNKRDESVNVVGKKAPAVPGSSCANDKPPPGVPNCVARRTRGQLFAGKLRPVDYKKFFEEKNESDEDMLTSSSSTFGSIYTDFTSEDEIDDIPEEQGVEGSCWSGDDGDGNCSTKAMEVDGTTLFHPYEATRKPQRSRTKKKKKRVEEEKDDAKQGDKKVDVEGSDPGSSFSSSSAGGDETKSKASKKKSKSRKRKRRKTRRQETRTSKAQKRKREDDLGGEELLKTFIEGISLEDKLHEPALAARMQPILPTVESLNEGGELLPLLFSFQDDDPKPPEKTEQEKLTAQLWGDYELALRSKDMDLYDNNKDEELIADEPEKVHYSAPCVEKKHCFVLDNEFGVVCRFCGYVKLQMREILPSFANNSVVQSRVLSGVKRELAMLDQIFANDAGNDITYASNLPTGTVWDLIPGTKETMYPHQQDGFEFMWRNLTGDIILDNLKNSSNSDEIGGCVISHAPGTGKTRLAIVFLESFMMAFPNSRPVIMAPRGLLTMWENEFGKWKVKVQFHLLNSNDSTGMDDAAGGTSRSGNTWLSRLTKLCKWSKGHGVLGLSYGLFERLVNQTSKKTAQSALISEALTEKPGLFVFDEGHTPRNERSNIWKTLEKIKTERRIILSGTPFQNNFGELYNTLCLVRPKFAANISGTESKLRTRNTDFFHQQGTAQEKDGGKGKWTSLTSSINNDSLEQLRSMIQPFVHVHNGSILKRLPGLKECLIVLNLNEQQKSIVDRIEACSLDKSFALEYKVSLAAIHPCLCAAYGLTDDEKAGIDMNKLQAQRLNPDDGAKTRFVMELIRLSGLFKEKVLIFSQFLEPLSLIKDQLASRFNWTEGREILQMDGKIQLKHRQAAIDQFNDPTTEVRVLLASTRACCEGISLTGASRVVLLDVVWNPSVENQAISRAFRIGQEKVVHTYHLIAADTREIDKYSTQTKKEHISKLVFSSSTAGPKNAQEDNMAVVIHDDKILEMMKGLDKLKDMFNKVVFRPKANFNLLGNS